MTQAHQLNKAIEKKRVFLVEDHPITLEGLAQIIGYQPDLAICGDAATAADALKKIPAAKPDLVITDISLASGSGLDLIKDVASHLPGLPVLVLSMHDEKNYAERVLRAGARGYVMKSEPSAVLLERIRRVLRGEIALSRAIGGALLDRISRGITSGDEIERLTNRELEVFRLLGDGRSTGEIATMLKLGVSTVETYRAKIKEKLNLANATDLVTTAVRWVAENP